MHALTAAHPLKCLTTSPLLQREVTGGQATLSGSAYAVMRLKRSRRPYEAVSGDTGHNHANPALYVTISAV